MFLPVCPGGWHFPFKHQLSATSSYTPSTFPRPPTPAQICVCSSPNPLLFGSRAHHEHNCKRLARQKRSPCLGTERTCDSFLLICLGEGLMLSGLALYIPRGWGWLWFSGFYYPSVGITVVYHHTRLFIFIFLIFFLKFNLQFILYGVPKTGTL